MGDLDGTELTHWRELPPAQRREWWEDVWNAAITLRARYRLALRHGWWEDAIQVEALAAFHAWLRLYDTGAYTDPPGKLQLLWELERLRAVVRAGETAFDPATDRGAFERHLDRLERPAAPPEPDRPHRQAVVDELSAVNHRLAELRDREQLLAADHDPPSQRRSDAQTDRGLGQLRVAIDELSAREQQLRVQLTPDDDRSAAH